MAPKHSAATASTKRKASSTDKHGDNDRSKKAKTVTGPKHRKFKDEEDDAADSDDGSGFSDSGDGGAELKHAKSSRGPGKPNGNGKPAERGLFPFLALAAFPR
jgi:pumilio family protein 6